MANRQRLELATRPTVNEPESLVRFATLAVLFDELAGEAGLTDASAQSLHRYGCKISLSTLRTRVYRQLTADEWHRVSSDLALLFDAIDQAMLSGDGRVSYPGEYHLTSSLRLLAGRLLGQVGDGTRSRHVPDRWWSTLRGFDSYRGAGDVILAAEAAIAWLDSAHQRLGDLGTSPLPTQGVDALSDDLATQLDRVVCGLGELMGGGLGFTSAAIESLSALLVRAHRLDREAGAAVLKRIEEFLASDFGGNNVLRVLDRALRDALALANGPDEALVGFITELTIRFFSEEDRRSDLWMPDVYGPRLVRLAAHYGSAGVRTEAISLLIGWATAPGGVVDGNSARACIWAVLEFALDDGRNEWERLGESLRAAAPCSASADRLDLWERLDRQRIELLTQSSPTRGSARDLVTFPLVGGNEKVSEFNRFLSEAGFSDLLERHLSDEANTWAPTSAEGGVSLNPAIRDGLSELLIEAVATPSAIRMRTVNETIENSGPMVRLATLRFVAATLNEVASQTSEYPSWLAIRVVHLAGLRTTKTFGLENYEQELHESIVASLFSIVMTESTKPEAEFVRARAIWSLGDIVARGLLRVDHMLAAFRTGDLASSAAVAVATVRLVALAGLAEPVHLRKSRNKILAVQRKCEEPSVVRMARWGLRRLDHEESNSKTFTPFMLDETNAE